ncbi:MAG: type II toxin-antitoxin system death-on-curing family toxin [Pseudomonadota bacterium]
MTEPKWLLRSVVDAMHDAQLAEHGGLSGIRDENMLLSALDRPQNAWGYGEKDLHSLAAAYAFGIVKNHPYADGNKRTAFLCAFVFLRINGIMLRADEVSATTTVLRMASGDIGQDEFAHWLRDNSIESQS